MAFKVENWSKRSWQLGQKGEPYLVVWLRGFKPCSDNKPQPLLRNWVEASCGVSWQKGCCGGLFGGGRPRHRRNLKTFSEAVLSFLLGWSRLLRLLFFPVFFWFTITRKAFSSILRRRDFWPLFYTTDHQLWPCVHLLDFQHNRFTNANLLLSLPYVHPWGIW